jgi:Flp pilus assembly protein TadD
LILALVGASTAPAQVPLPTEDSKEARLNYWAEVMKAATARIEILGENEEPVRETYGVVLGTPPMLVTRLTSLIDAEKAVATFPGGQQATATVALAADSVNNIAILKAEGSLPDPPELDDKIKWGYREQVYVIPAPGMDPAWPTETTTAPLKLDKLCIVPMTGDAQGCLPVMYASGWWAGMSGRLEDESGSFVYVTRKEEILPVLFGPTDPKPLADAARMMKDYLAPTTPEGLLARAVIRSYESTHDARPFFDLAVERWPEMPEIHYWYGKNHFNEQQYVKAEASFREAFRLRPLYEDARQMAGASANQQGAYATALELYNDGLAIFPQSTKLMINKWGALYNLGRMQEAVDVLLELLEIDPMYELAMYNLGMTYHRLGKHLDAEEQHTKLSNLKSKFAPVLRKKLDGE